MKDKYIRKQDAVGVIEKEMESYVSDIWYKSAIHSALNDVNENIKALEPVDVVPVVHGHWMPQKGGGLCCSECGHYALDEPDGNFIHVSVPSEFCPHCGAYMDGERRE